MNFITITLKKYDAKLLFTDTASLVYEIKSNDVYKDLYENKYLFDFSDYSEDSNFLIMPIKKLMVR